MKMGNWNIEVRPTVLLIEQLQFNPGEAEKLTGLLGFARKMAGLNTLPEKIGNPPFEIRFEDNGGILLKRVENTAIALKTSFAELDDLVETINGMIKMTIDERTLRPQIRPTATFNSPVGGDIFEGQV